ncbi:aldehyde dehydrogenase family protein [Lacibacter sediminis]|uniref:Aldehyde dehydrogenase n=1 Tax=Lacibacter sediminis TaxID=2760713 RepID=A0A7G5XHF3_9BACT|nr:aldehyde dehydrogenase family protein [Lacibacter sediminis]QNA44906.1 aldehyde dehydrogenase family protein [Lacibacter sediminis]
MNPYQTLYDSQVAYYKSGATRTVVFRKEQLKKLESLLRNNEQLIEEALYKDLRKHKQEVYMTELGPTYEEIRVQLRGVRQWMQPQTVETPLYLLPSVTKLYPEPVGNVIVISPWNYPVLLTYRAVAGAIAAGNTVIIKHSELSHHTSTLMEQLINKHFPADYIHAVQGHGETVVPQLLEHFHFGHVFFTGGTEIGKKIMGMAAKQLSPVSLELGGKSPCIVDASADLKMASKRIVWGKLLNCGQSCVAPDYLVVHESVKDKLIQTIIKTIEECYGTDREANDNYGCIINNRRFQSIVKYLQDGNVLYGGDVNEESRHIGPTIIDNVKPDAAVMREEIFGPVLPVFTYRENEEVLKLVDLNPNPLAVYIFSTSTATQDYFVEKISFGAGCINETIYQLGSSSIPFGGIGTSGHGGHLGKFSFDTFTHYKGIVKKVNWFEPFFRYPPFSKSKLRLWRLALGRK